MKILQLHSENVKRIKAIDITPQDNVIILSGKNGEGKTSVLDSIWLALEYKAAKKGNPSPLREGQKNGKVEIDLGDYIVTRRFTASGSTLEIKNANGDKIASPQKLLDGFIGSLSFDPWEFSRKSEKDQRQMLADVLYSITGGKVDLADFDVRHQAAFEARTELNKEKRRLATIITTISPPVQSDPTDELSIADLTQAIASAVTLDQRASALKSRERQLLEQIAKLQEELSQVTTEISNLPEVPDVELLKNELTNIESRNKRAREVAEYRKIKTALDQIDRDIQRRNDEMELISIEKSEALENSPLPVENLRVIEDGIRVVNEEGKLVPFCQASAAQRLRISLGIAIAANPKLRVIRISDGSLLDDESMRIVQEMADDENFQIWIEYASRNDNDRMGVYIEDGTVVSD